METTDLTGRWIAAAVVTLGCALVAAWPRATAAQGAPPAASHPVGIRQLEFLDQDRHLALAVFYPAVVRDRAAVPFVMPFFDKLKSYRDVEVASEGAPFPLVVFSHGRGSNGLYYAGSPNSWPRAATSSPRSITTAPIPTIPRSRISPTSSGSDRAMSASPSVFC